ncbi:alpha-galactosidase [Kitasatospora sp. NPDC058965]|uniref:alpha-galactosidase n=1 Tax=Kitasatospora sp. NPDC058965 TaxID=3346682 RepID=UPI0036A17891
MRTTRRGRRAARAAVAATLLSAAALPLFGAAPPAAAEGNGVALTPPMGWSTWSFLRGSPNQSTVEAEAKAMADSGLLAHGYSYVNLDDFWYLNPGTTVDGYGRWVTDMSKFPSGMAGLASYVHALGEKFGMYLTPGIPVAAYNQNTPIQGTSFHARDIVSDTTHYEANYNFGNGSMYAIDYAKNPAAAQAFLNSWADQLASYGADYLKLDGVGDWDAADIQHWSQALNQSGRAIHLELSNSLDPGNAWAWQAWANGWRIDGDVECYCSASSFPLTSWSSVSRRFADAPAWTRYAGPGGWNDLDSLEVGNGSNDGLTPDERQSAETLWAVNAAPLLLGVDLTNLDAGDKALLTNDEVIAVDQAGHPAHPVDQLTQQQVWSTANPDGSYTVALFNLAATSQTVTAKFTDLGFSGSAAVHDDWTHTDLGTATGSFSAALNPHASRLLRLTPAAGLRYTAMPYHLVNAATGQYLDVSGAGTGDGAGLVQQPANGANDQLWQLVPDGDGSYRLVNCNSGRLANVPGWSTTSGTQLVQWDDDHGANSHWTLSPTGSGSYTITSRSSGQNIDVSGGTVVQAGASGGAGQQWRLVPAPAPGAEYKLVNGASGGRMDVQYDATTDGAPILQWQDNGQRDQLWILAAQPGGSYTVADANSGKLLNIPGPTTNQATQLIQYYDDGNPNSRWTLVDAGPNLVQLRSAYDGQVVDLYNNSTADGAAVQQFPANGGANQTWSLVSPTSCAG